MRQLITPNDKIIYCPQQPETTKIHTTRLGEIEVLNTDIVTLPEGLVGFPEYTRYVMLDHDVDSPFKWLQSLDEGAICFVVVDPTSIDSTYHAEITDEQAALLDLTDPADAVFCVIITMPSNPHNMTANFKAPLVFNLKNRNGKQIILSNPEYTTRINVLERMKQNIEPSK